MASAIRYGNIIRYHWSGKRETLYANVPEPLAMEWLASTDAQRDTMPRGDWQNLDDRYTYDDFTPTRWGQPQDARYTIKRYQVTGEVEATR